MFTIKVQVGWYHGIQKFNTSLELKILKVYQIFNDFIYGKATGVLMPGKSELSIYCVVEEGKERKPCCRSSRSIY